LTIVCHAENAETRTETEDRRQWRKKIRPFGYGFCTPVPSSGAKGRVVKITIFSHGQEFNLDPDEIGAAFHWAGRIHKIDRIDIAAPEE